MNTDKKDEKILNHSENDTQLAKVTIYVDANIIHEAETFGIDWINDEILAFIKDTNAKEIRLIKS